MKNEEFLPSYRLIVLDEVDQLDCRGQEVLYTLFEWPALPKSKLLLIGKSLALP
jgi:cell division control protein 6